MIVLFTVSLTGSALESENQLKKLKKQNILLKEWSLCKSLSQKKTLAPAHFNSHMNDKSVCSGTEIWFMYTDALNIAVQTKNLAHTESIVNITAL